MKPLLDETEDALERKLLEEARDYKASQTARAAALAIVATGKPVSFFKGVGLKVSLAVVAVAAVGGAWWMRKPAATHVDPPAPVVTTETTVTSQPTPRSDWTTSFIRNVSGQKYCVTTRTLIRLFRRTFVDVLLAYARRHDEAHDFPQLAVRPTEHPPHLLLGPRAE